MIRVLVFLGVLLALAFGFSWLADHPGELTLVWQGAEVKTSTMVVAVAIVVFAVAVLALWSLLRGILRTPGAVGSFFQRRRRERGWRALSQGMIAVGAGDPTHAGRLARDARRVLGAEPLALLLEAQAAQLAGDRAGAHEAFERMLEDPETRLLGLRGLYVEAGRYEDAAAARHFAAEANALAPRVAWAGQALLEFQSQDHDWDAALATLERNARNRIVDKARAKRLRAVLLTARALDIELGEPDAARNLALEAHGLAPELVPAALAAARLLGRAGDIKRAARVLEATWKLEPHPELADAYAHLRPGDSALDRLARIRDLIRVRAHHPECAFALARAELDARNFAAARAALKPVVQPAPSRRACLLLAEIEEAEHGPAGRVRGWLARAARAPRDPAWVADGFVAERWAAVSPLTGRLDAFEWKVPAELLPGPVADPLDDAEEAFAEAGGLAPLEAARPEPVRVEAPRGDGPRADAPRAEAPRAEPPASEPARAVPARTEPARAPRRAVDAARRPEPVLLEASPEPGRPAPVEPAEPTRPAAERPSAERASAERVTAERVAAADRPAEKIVVLPKGAGEPARPLPAYPFGQAPDDPGPGDASDLVDGPEPTKRFRLFS